MQRATRRRLLSSALAAGASVGSLALLAACGRPGASAPTVASATAPGPTAAPASSGNAAASTSSAPSSATPAGAPVFAPTQTASAGVPGPELVVKPPKSPQPITLRFHMRTGGEKSEPAIYVDRPNEWKQATGNDYKLEPIPGDVNYVPKIFALAAGNTLGDLLFTGDEYGEHHHMIQYGIIQPVDDYLASYHVSKDEWFKTTVDTITVDGKMYGLPKASNPAESFVTINLQMFKDAGIPAPPTYGVTFDQIRTWANQLSKGPPDSREVYGYYTVVNSNQSVTNGVRQRGGDLVDSDGLHSLVDRDPFHQWLAWNYQLIVQDKAHPLGGVVPQGDASAIAGMFAAGKLAMAHSHRSWQYPFKNAIKNKFDWTTIQYPAPRGPGAGCRTSTPTAERRRRNTKTRRSRSATRWPTAATPTSSGRRKGT